MSYIKFFKVAVGLFLVITVSNTCNTTLVEFVSFQRYEHSKLMKMIAVWEHKTFKALMCLEKETAGFVPRSIRFIKSKYKASIVNKTILRKVFFYFCYFRYLFCSNILKSYFPNI